MKDFHLKEWMVQALAWLKKLPWIRIGLISLCSVLALVLIVLVFVTAYVEHLMNHIIIDPNANTVTQPSTEYSAPTLPSDFTGVTIPPDAVTMPSTPNTIIAHEDILNIMLVGQDRREGENYRTRSDAMILCTFNKRNKTITMTSFMRDLYVTIPGHQPNKMNAAYQWGGMPLLRETMMENFGVQVDAFVEVDFSGFTKVVDVLGGVTITLTQAEADHLNSLHGWSLTAGDNHLNGDQALQYSRIRAIGSDFGRTERQRKVISAIITGCKNMNLAQLTSLLNSILPLVSTDIPSSSQAVDYAMDLFPMLSGSSTITQRIPIDGSYSLVYVGALDVVLPDMVLNRQFLVDTLLPK